MEANQNGRYSSVMVAFDASCEMCDLRATGGSCLRRLVANN